MNADTLENDVAFPYLGRTVAFNNSNWAYMYQNLWKAWDWWGVVVKVLTRAGLIVRAWVILYNTVLQTVLPYGINIWVVMGSMLKVQEGFHHRVARRVASNTAWHTVDGDWEWPPLADSLEIVGIRTIKEYIQRRQATITAHIAC